tara:strand:+ start:408 stop:1061 length:654 start_codon:yes stop_codon:yes gene_type:complete
MTDTNENPVSELDLRARIQYETLRALASNGKSSFFISIVNAVIVFFTLRDVTEQIVLNLWLAAVVILTLLRTTMVIVFNRLDSSSQHFDLWTAIYIVFACGSALCWGILPLLDVFYLAGWTETFIVFLIAGMSAGGLVSLYPSLLAAVPYQLCMLVPLIYALGSSGAPAHTAMAILASLYLVLLVRSTYDLNQSASASIRLEMENNELFKFLLKARK